MSSSQACAGSPYLPALPFVRSSAACWPVAPHLLSLSLTKGIDSWTNPFAKIKEVLVEI